MSKLTTCRNCDWNSNKLYLHPKQCVGRFEMTEVPDGIEEVVPIGDRTFAASTDKHNPTHVHLTEVRTTSSTGGEKGVKPQRHSLVPRFSVGVISEVYAFGAKKYSEHNWRKGYEWSKSYDALNRHMDAWWEREDNDPESGLTHLAHAGFHIFTLIVFSKDKRYAEFDDRYKEKPKEVLQYADAP